MQNMYDIAIIGAGPAGASLARMIGKKYKVLLMGKGGWQSHQKIIPLSSAVAGYWPPMRKK
jgi:choline dehydrogenase-like flavoprotein